MVIINYSTLNSEHNWEDLCIQLSNQQTRAPDNHNQIKESPISIWFLQMFHRRFANGWDPGVCKSNRLHVDILRFSLLK
jgi:hypothetical protein